MLEQLAAESRTWTSGETPALLPQKTSLATACWDTMGWILFKLPFKRVSNAQPLYRYLLDHRVAVERCLLRNGSGLLLNLI